MAGAVLAVLAVLAGKYRVPGGSRGCVVDHFLLAGFDNLSSLSPETADGEHQMPPGICMVSSLKFIS